MGKSLNALIFVGVLSLVNAQGMLSMVNSLVKGNLAPGADFKVICYYNKLSQNRTDSMKYNFSDVDSSLCSHVVYSYATINALTLKIDPLSLGQDFGNFSTLKGKGITVMLALGSQNDTGEALKFSKIVNDGRLRAAFVEDTVHFLRANNLQGIDINWAYPSCWNGNCMRGRPADKKTFNSFLRELHIAFQPHKLKLSVAVSPLDEIADHAYDVKKIFPNVDWINLMTFDYNNDTYTATASHSPLGGHAPNIKSTVKYWKSRGTPSEKLVIAIPTFGRTFSLQKESWNAPGSPASIGKPTGLQVPGLAAYFEICSGLDYQLIEGVEPFAYKGDQWVSFDDVNITRQKGEYILKNKLGGALLWSLDTDDFSGSSCQQGKYPLLKSLRRGLGMEVS